MEIQFVLNDKQVKAEVGADTILLNVLRDLGCKSVKCGCETTNCGLCTVWINGNPAFPARFLPQVSRERALRLWKALKRGCAVRRILADEGAEQCGFCSPGFIMNVLAMARELQNPTLDEIKEYLAGNLCRCTGYMGQLRAIKNI